MVRSIANHGIRVLPYRFHSRHDIKENDVRWFSSGRWISAYYDASPAVAEIMEVCIYAPVPVPVHAKYAVTNSINSTGSLLYVVMVGNRDIGEIFLLKKGYSTLIIVLYPLSNLLFPGNTFRRKSQPLFST